MTKVIQYNNEGEYIHSSDGKNFSKNLLDLEVRSVELKPDVFYSSRKRIKTFRDYIDLDKSLKYEDIVNFLQNNSEMLSQNRIEEIFNLLRGVMTDHQINKLEEQIENFDIDE